jgi:hypothetical protein
VRGIPNVVTTTGRAKVREYLALRRAGLAMGLFRALGGRYAGLVPRGTTCSIPEILGDASSCPNVVRVSPVCRASVETYDIPEGLPPAFRRERAFSTRNVYSMRNVIVGIPTGVCLSNERLFLESYGNPFRWFDPSPTGPRPKELSLSSSIRSLPFDGPATCFGTATYGHVLLQEVPRLLYAFEERPELTVITRKDPPRFMIELLALLQDKQVITRGVVELPRGLYRAADYTFTADEEDTGFFRKESVNIIRRYLCHEACEADGPAEQSPRAVYLSRRRSDRSFTNEADVEAMMSAKGFAVIYSEDLDVAQEIALFQQADIIVGPHGAGLCNLVWVKPGTRVVEILSPKMISDFFVRLASLVQVDHALCWARPDAGWGSVDLDELASLVDSMYEPRRARRART